MKNKHIIKCIKLKKPKTKLLLALSPQLLKNLLINILDCYQLKLKYQIQEKKLAKMQTTIHKKLNPQKMQVSHKIQL